MSLLNRRPRPAIIYPESDGKPMAENTLQFQWIVTVKEGLERIYIDRPNVFVAGTCSGIRSKASGDLCRA